MLLNRIVAVEPILDPAKLWPVAAALLWKHALFNPSYGLLNGLLRTFFGTGVSQLFLEKTA